MNRKEFYEGLSEDLKARLRNCKSEQEMMSVLDEEKIELDPGILEEINGGKLVCNGLYCGDNQRHC